LLETAADPQAHIDILKQDDEDVVEEVHWLMFMQKTCDFFFLVPKDHIFGHMSPLHSLFETENRQVPWSMCDVRQSELHWVCLAIADSAVPASAATANAEPFHQ